jgi:hypothetical protein
MTTRVRAHSETALAVFDIGPSSQRFEDTALFDRYLRTNPFPQVSIP